MARPDRWVSWQFDGVRQGVQMIRAHKPAAIWSTYPIATAHMIGASLHRQTGVPWIADFRDPMAQDGYPDDPLTRQRFLEIEAEAIGQSSFSLMTTPGAARMYCQRYPQWADKIQVLENGYDEESFQNAESAIGDVRPPLNPGAFTFLHSGIIYPAERDPTQLIVALGCLKKRFPDHFARIKFRFRAAVHDQLLNDLAKAYGVESCIETLPPIPYREALAEMLCSDGLLVMQAANCNDQVPAKIYEYLRARKPVLSLTDPAGDTATVLRAAGCMNIADIANADEIVDALVPYLLGTQGLQLPTDAVVQSASRRQRTAQLATLLNSL
jgi:glycosyltransferase involved in cell wall biosynthesis